MWRVRDWDGTGGLVCGRVMSVSVGWLDSDWLVCRCLRHTNSRWGRADVAHVSLVRPFSVRMLMLTRPAHARCAPHVALHSASVPVQVVVVLSVMTYHVRIRPVKQSACGRSHPHSHSHSHITPSPGLTQPPGGWDSNSAANRTQAKQRARGPRVRRTYS